ncbi:MAG: type II secretion system F family protein [Frankiaceae bacterium]|nr:type II secretion system F family protein [Frankiaceae bacterium]MBV9873020.1 type II secretion system F family protein [Frankiaceae bacterium]
MGALLGLVLGFGLLLVWRSGPRAPQRRSRSGPSIGQRVDELLTQAGYLSIRPAQLYAVCAGCGLLVLVLVLGISRSPSIAVSFAGFAAYSPFALVRYRHRQRTTELRDVWPDVVDNLASAVRAGLALPEALAQVAARGPVQLRPAFQAFAADYRATGKFADCLDRLKERLADPIGDRVVESMRVAREVGGTDLGRLLRTLSQFLRDDLRTRAEIEARQGWTIAAARLALAAPWLVLAMLAFRPDTVAAYNTPIGIIVLAGGATASFVAYRLMVRIAALPLEARVLR